MAICLQRTCTQAGLHRKEPEKKVDGGGTSCACRCERNCLQSRACRRSCRCEEHSGWTDCLQYDDRHERRVERGGVLFAPALSQLRHVEAGSRGSRRSRGPHPVAGEGNGCHSETDSHHTWVWHSFPAGARGWAHRARRHLDHILAAGEVKAATGAPILIHRQDLLLYQALPMQWCGRSAGKTQTLNRVAVPCSDWHRPRVRCQRRTRSLRTNKPLRCWVDVVSTHQV